MTAAEDEWEQWLTYELDDPEHRTFGAGCLIVIGVCVIIWLAAIIGAVQLYRHTPLDPITVTPPPAATHPPSPTTTPPHLEVTTPAAAPEDLDRP